MSFVKKNWLSRIVEYPTRRILTKSDGTTETVTVARSEGTVAQEGDSFSSANMNDLENRIGNAIDGLQNNLGYQLISLNVADRSDANEVGLAIINYINSNKSKFKFARQTLFKIIDDKGNTNWSVDILGLSQSSNYLSAMMYQTTNEKPKLYKLYTNTGGADSVVNFSSGLDVSTYELLTYAIRYQQNGVVTYTATKSEGYLIGLTKSGYNQQTITVSGEFEQIVGDNIFKIVKCNGSTTMTVPVSSGMNSSEFGIGAIVWLH